MFAVKNFSPLVQLAKIYHAEKKHAKISRSTVDQEMFAVKKRRWRIFYAWKFITWKKKKAKISRSTVYPCWVTILEFGRKLTGSHEPISGPFLSSLISPPRFILWISIDPSDIIMT